MRVRRIILGLIVAVLAAGLGILAPANDEDDIEKVLTAVVEAYRTGDYDAMGRYYAPDCTVVSFNYGPPVVGWANVARLYQSQHASLAGAEMIRENTMIQRKGKVAWVTYQWQFAANVRGALLGYQGHSTLVLEKRSRRWLVVHNHTSALPASTAPEPSS